MEDAIMRVPGPTAAGTGLALGGVSLERLFAGLERIEPGADACFAYDLDAVAARAHAFQRAFAPVRAFAAYAMKANGLPALLERLARDGFGADAGSLGELLLAAAAGFPAERTVLNGNGRSAAEAEWAAARGVRLVNADLVDELDLLEHAAARHGRRLRVALRVNPGIETPGHRHVATGDDAAKFGMAPADALAAWSGGPRWPHLDVDGLHVHVGSQILEPAPLLRALAEALALVDEAARRGAAVRLVNMGGGMGVDDEGRRAFPLEAYAERIAEAAAGRALEWTFEPGRWLVAEAGVLLARVRWVKRRGAHRFVVLAAGMNDFLRPALYGARHGIVAVTPRPGAAEPATVVGPVCESGDVFARDVPLPPLEPGDLVAILRAGAYGAAMASSYNGRGRLPEVVVEDGRARRARRGETPEDLAARRTSDPLDV
jgi:diaminopimelate decarboxylase